jgi:hypothetical protein
MSLINPFSILDSTNDTNDDNGDVAQAEVPSQTTPRTDNQIRTDVGSSVTQSKDLSQLKHKIDGILRQQWLLDFDITNEPQLFSQMAADSRICGPDMATGRCFNSACGKIHLTSRGMLSHNLRTKQRYGKEQRQGYCKVVPSVEIDRDLIETLYQKHDESSENDEDGNKDKENKIRDHDLVQQERAGDE